MRRVSMAMVLAMGFVAPGSVLAATGLRIGVVNIQRAVSETTEGKAAEEQLTKLKGQLENTLNRKLKEFYEREKKLREAWAILKEPERRKRADESRQKMESLQKEYMGAERQLMERKTQAMLKITNKLNKIIERLAAREKFDYIFANAAVLWAPRHVDLTNEVIRMYNNQNR